MLRSAIVLCLALGSSAWAADQVSLTTPEDKGDFGGYAADLIAGNTHDAPLEQMLRKKVAELKDKPIEAGIVKQHPAAEGLGLRPADYPDVGAFALSELNRNHYGEDLNVTIKKHIADIAARHKAEIDAKLAAEKAARDAKKRH